ncbi:MAG: hypothetical protein ACLUCE_02545 [Streptococcus sp.]|uniref:hypothetical protein n=1 Tax=Streptococcus sp. TaxID=1306 RepID=UPI0039959176
MELCSDYYDGQGAIKSYDQLQNVKLSLAANDQFARDGLRVLAVAYRPLESQHIKEDRVGYADPRRRYGLCRTQLP